MKSTAELRAETHLKVRRLIEGRPQTLADEMALWLAVDAAIDAEIAAARPQWQPIETAPK